jgi:hypothetical protein
LKGVSLATASRPFRSQSRRQRKTAFERILLPGFAEWLVRQVERCQPDFLIPAETKGARLLDAALAFARDELGSPISVPVVYSSALAYMDPEVLRGSRVTIVDDAVCTGANLDLHRSWIASYGVADIQALVCVGLDENSPKRSRIECYLNVDRPVYEQCTWQLTELVVARGLPPEVDHFVFEARVSDRLAFAWRELEEVLAGYGHLTIDGPASKRGRMLPMTLHFPSLPTRPGRSPVPSHPGSPHKLRLFPDPAQDRFLVLPISLPTLTLEPGVNPEQPLSADWARQQIHEGFGGDAPAGDLLIDDARTLHPKTVFRALSSATEFELIRGFAEVLGATLPGSTLIGQQEPFDRLFGLESGERVAGLVRREVSDALARGEEHGVRLPESATEPPFLDSSVADATRTIATHLKEMYDEEEDLTQRLGLSMREIADVLETDDFLLVSRCISFGLAMTTLVPYIEAKEREEDGTVQVERFYRVSENNRGRRQTYTDIDGIHREKSEQAIALICHRIRTACPSYEDTPIPEELLAVLTGVLHPLILDEQDVALCTRPGIDEVELLLLDGIPPVPFGSAGSKYYEVVGDGVVPTERFLRLYEHRQLDLDLDGSIEGIETHVDLLKPFIEGLTRDQLMKLMSCWAMSTDRRLGLMHVRRSLNAALEEMRRPLKLILREQAHDRSPGTAARARKYALAAACKLQRLSTDWSAPPLDQWPKPGRREQRLLASLGAPSSEGRAIYDLPVALATVTAALGEVVENLDKASVRHWVDEGEITAFGEAARRQAVGAAINWCAVVRHRLTSLSDEGDAPSIPEHPRDAIVAAAETLLDTVDLLDAFIAAIAGEFRGEENEQRPAGTANKQRNVAILSLDIAKATNFGQLRGAETTHHWKEEALDIAAQWTRAFGSWPIGKRRGDEIRVEFDQTDDVSVLCAAIVQQHAAALRSAGGEDLGWKFHSAIDCGQVQEGPDNLTGPPIDRASKLAKLCDKHCKTDDVYVTKDVQQRCAPSLREDFSKKQPMVSLDGSDGDTMSIQPFAIDSADAMGSWVERLQELGEWIARAPLKGGAGEAPLWFGPDPAESGKDAESTSG